MISRMTDSEGDKKETTENMVTAEITDSSSTIIRDKYWMTYILFYIMGVMIVVPDRFFMTAGDYWMYKFRNTTSDTDDPRYRTTLQTQFLSSYSIVAHTTKIGFVLITIKLSRHVGVTNLLLYAIGTVVVMFTITAILVEVNTDSWQTTFFVLTLIIATFLTATGSIFMIAISELSARFPAEYLATLLSGQSIGGILAALIQIAALSVGPSSTTNGLVYFLIGTVFLFVTLVYYIAVMKWSEFFKYNIKKVVEAQQKPQFTKEMLFHVFNKIKFLLLSMIILYGSSVIVYPGVAGNVASVNKGNKWNDIYFKPVITYLCYSIFEYSGRELVVKIKKPANGMVILVISICFVAFVPLIIFCNAQPRNHHSPVVFNADYYYIIFVLILAFSNGYLTNLCVLQIPSMVLPEERLVGTLLIIVVMLLSVSALSFLTPVVLTLL